MANRRVSSFHFIVIYGLLAICLLHSLGRATGESSAMASEPADQRVRLGPADSLTLRDESGKELTLINSDQRISWSANKLDRVWTVGFVRVQPVLAELTKDRPQPAEIDELNKQMQAAYETYMTESEPVRKEIETLNPSDPKYRELYGRNKEMADRYSKVRDECTKKRDKILATAMAAVFEELRSAIDIVSKRRNIDIILQAYASDDELSTDQYASTTWTIALRTVLRYPEGADISDEVLEELTK